MNELLKGLENGKTLEWISIHSRFYRLENGILKFSDYLQRWDNSTMSKDDFILLIKDVPQRFKLLN